MSKRVTSNVRLRSAILLEQIRAEASGKRMLIGVYGDNVIFQKRPSIFNAIILVTFDIHDQEDMVIKFRARAPSFVGYGEAKIAPSDEKRNANVEVEAPFTSFVTDQGKVLFDWKVNGGSWQPAIEWKLSFPENAEAASPEEITKLRSLFEFQAQLQGGSPMADAQMEMMREGAPPHPDQSGE